MIVIYHSRDADGWTSGAIVKKKYPDAKLIGFDYGQKLPMEQIPADEPIIMVDVSLPMQEMFDLSKHSGYKLTWIDHHISAINDYNKFIECESNTNIPMLETSFLTAVLFNGASACEGAWKYLFPSEPIPIAVTLLGEYDTWRNGDKQRWEKEILPFQFGMRLHCNSVESFPPALLRNDYETARAMIRNITEEGKTILKYQSQINELQCKKAAFEYTFEGLRAICLNGGGFNSDVFKSVYDEAKHDIMMPFQFDGKFWTISLYTTKPHIDCSVIAKKHKGGGHMAASGFQTDNLSTVFKNIPNL